MDRFGSTQSSVDWQPTVEVVQARREAQTEPARCRPESTEMTCCLDVHVDREDTINL